ncbi:thioesterase family protein [Aggregicoccus sp. 17bor-14]|uniref:acyl-CoA thioesterase n=1 Tax=Myxococcaceae TaxID=31 RepID=UPI00129CB62C|nr:MULTISPECIES: thioesterase family protein [Myxococcaceae]MBF5044552.1 thioesterase family protein [Simulacricoccus sp. 17bor-14]MRI90297.1 thioesterase family protein [Aggregicoccus sp. 17bor-14]
MTSSPFLLASTWAPRPESQGQYEALIGADWFQGRGAYGGVVGAGILRAMLHHLADAQRLPRSFTVHFCAPVSAGPATLQVRVERAGRQVSHLSARLEQAGGVAALASGTFAVSRESSLRWDTHQAPAVSPPRELPEVPSELLPTFAQHFDYRWAVGAPPFSGAQEALLGGWIRPRVPTPLDAPLAVALLDAFPPAASVRAEGFCNLATMDYTAHFYAALPQAHAADDAFFLRVGSSRHAASGYADDTAHLWSEDGKLLAQLRQVAALFA